MKNFIKFWQRDIINKMIVLLVLVLALGMAGLGFVVIKMPAGRSLKGVVDEFFPTPTMSAKAVMTRSAQGAMTQAAMATASVPPTITTMPFTPMATTAPATETSLPATSVFTLPATQPAISAPTATLPAPTATQPGQAAPTATAPPVPAPTTADATAQAAAVKCIPGSPVQKGKVLDVLDGTTIKVLIDGFAYVVRYIGIEPPANKNFATLAATTNGGLVFAKDITLVADAQDKDANGRLLRYVSAGDTFVNLALIQKGQVSTIDSTPNNACAGVFSDVEKAAREAGVGMWIPTPKP